MAWRSLRLKLFFDVLPGVADSVREVSSCASDPAVCDQGNECSADNQCRFPAQGFVLALVFFLVRVFGCLFFFASAFC